MGLRGDGRELSWRKQAVVKEDTEWPVGFSALRYSIQETNPP
jgi:hypothetical protein